MTRAAHPARLTLALSAGAMLLAACTSSSSDAPVVEKRPGDGVLTIGSLLPQSGDRAPLGLPASAGVDLAVQDVNAAGGVLGKPVVQRRADSGDASSKIASASVSTLLAAKSDVIVGTLSSDLSLSVLDAIAAAGAVEFSPADTSAVLDADDDEDMYFRTAPSDEVQGSVMGNLVLQDGAKSVAVIAEQDTYGETLADRVTTTIEQQGGVVAAKVLYSAGSTSYGPEIQKIEDSAPDAVVVIAPQKTAALVKGLAKAGVGPADVATYFVDGNAGDYSQDLPEGTLAGVKATRPGAEPRTAFTSRLLTLAPTLTEFAYGAEAYDATVLSALAAIAGRSDDGKEIAKHLQDVSADGTECRTFKACVALLDDGKDIDYDGVSGPVDLNDAGSPAEAIVGVFQYGAGNTDSPIEYVTATD